MDKERLFHEFPPITTEEWKEKITNDLKGADYDKKLVWRTPEGFKVQPFYRSEDLKNTPNLEVCPGDFPYLRGKDVKGNNWLVRQEIEVDEIEAANAKALDIRLKGVDSFGFNFKSSYKPTLEDIEKLLQNIRADLMELNFNSHHPVEVVEIIDTLAKKYNRDLEKVRGSVEFDPIDHYSRYGKFYHTKESDLALLESLLKASQHLKNFHVLTIDAAVFHNSGSGIVTQLAFALAKAVEYLNHLTENGFFIDDVAPKVRFNFAVGSSYFMEIAKFRAARYLWSNIVNAYGLNDAENAAMFIHCTNSQWNKTIYDPYVNMLRTTTETMSALSGGVDSMTVAPFNEVYESTTEFSNRIARNQQLVLKGESYFDKVNDPAAGSYYVEDLTQQIISESWKLFLEVDEMGGYLKAFENGFIQKKIEEEANQKRIDIASSKRTLLGTNKYPNVNEHLNGISEEVFNPSGDENENTLKPFRGAQAIEKLRYKTDQFALSGKRPEVWMLTFGNLAMRNARAQFAGNFFGCAGFQITNNHGFKTIESGIEAASASNADIVVVCSSDEEYAGNALKVYEALKGNKIIALAGYPADLVEELKSKGFSNFVHVRSNMLEELSRYQKELGIK
jgi:methylmalonyl-CoA mutase